MNSSQRAPAWVCGEHDVPGYKDKGFGTYGKSPAGYQFALDQATARARVDLAGQIRTRAEGMIKDYTAAAGGENSRAAVDASSESVKKTITAETLTGSKVVRSGTDALGNVYVVVGMDLEASNKRIEQALQSSMKNESAIWQKMLGNKGQADMTAEIMKLAK
jgi:hypothetical protein